MIKTIKRFCVFFDNFINVVLGVIQIPLTILPILTIYLLLNNFGIFASMIPIGLYLLFHYSTLIIKRLNGEKGLKYFRLDNSLVFSLVPFILYVYFPEESLFVQLFLLTLPLLIIAGQILEKALKKNALYYSNKTYTHVNIVKTKNFRLLHFVIVQLVLIIIIFNLPIILCFLLLVWETLYLLLITIKVYLRFYGKRNSRLFIENNLRRVNPKFALYFAAPTNTDYQVGMWIDYFHKINEEFLIILRNKNNYEQIRKMTTKTMLICPKISDLNILLNCSSLKTIFYVNNSMYNVHMVRFINFTHVQLLHGDSDKSFSFNPVTIMFDKIFVAGQAAIDRYENNGVNIPLEKFEIVGRPQVEKIKQINSKSSCVKNILYAPTWKGNYSETNYSSLPLAQQIIKSLINKNLNIIFRPHKYSYKDKQHRSIILQTQELLKKDALKSNRMHVYGDAAENEMSLYDCFNSVDAMISDISSITSDFLYSCKPFAIVAMVEEQSLNNFFPITKYSYILKNDFSNINSVLDNLLLKDDLVVERSVARSYYLGNFQSQDYANNFINKAKNIIDGKL